MELFSNLLWIVLSSFLLSIWLLRRNQWEDESLRSRVPLQIIALALLIVVLLPVVSLTDDLQACTMPAESDHLSRRSDFQAIADFSLHPFSFLVVASIPFQVSPPSRTLARLPIPAKTDTPCAEYLRILGSRPPPAV